MREGEVVEIGLGRQAAVEFPTATIGMITTLCVRRNLL